MSTGWEWEPETPTPEPEPVSFGDTQVEDVFLGDVSVNGDEVSFGEPEGVTLPPLTEDDKAVFGASQPVGDGECVVCGAPTFRPPGLTKSGRRKRTPKYCDIHSPNIRVSSERPDFTGVESQLRRIQEELADDLRLLGTLAGPLFPVTGYYVFEHADPFTVAILKLAKNNTRVLRILHRAASVAPIYTVAECVAGTAYAVQVDTKKADPHNTVGRRLGVSRAYDAVYPDSTSSNGSNIAGNGNWNDSTFFAPPPRYGAGVQ